MVNLIVFILSTASISWIVVKSKLFLRLRMYITIKHALSKDPKEASKIKIIRTIKTKTLWYIDNIINCMGCCGVYSGFLSYLLLNHISIEIIAYSLSGSVISLIASKFI